MCQLYTKKKSNNSNLEIICGEVLLHIHLALSGIIVKSLEKKYFFGPLLQYTTDYKKYTCTCFSSSNGSDMIDCYLLSARLTLEIAFLQF